jgi:methylenetetrahydrofolate reductase (NADPH)
VTTMATTSTPTATSLSLQELIGRSRYEVIPLKDVEEKILAHVPRDVTLTVTVSPVKGLEPSFELAETFAKEGYSVVPHLAARLVTDRSHLAEIVARFTAMGTREVFVVAGDAEQAAGIYEGAAPLLRDLHELGHPFEQIGITGYPETHPLIDAAAAIAAMNEKAPYANYIATQICFDSKVTARWIEEVWARGTRLPVYVGIPGAVQRAKLLRVSTRIGIGESIRFLRKHGNFVTRFLQPGGFSPDRLIKGLGPALADPEQKVAGFHIFTFNDLAETEAWRQRKLAGN